MVIRKTNQVRAMEGRGSVAAAAVLLGGLFGLAPALAQDSRSVTVDVGECVELESAEDRFACYEAQVDAALSVTVDVGECIDLESAEDRLACYEAQVDAALEERDAPDPDERVAVTQDGEVDEDRSAGDEAPTSRERRTAEQSQEPEAAEGQYFGTITAIRERLPDSYIITLDNGEIWEQVAPKWYPLRPGLEVRIYQSIWGNSYRLSAVDLSGYIQVRKVR